MAFVFYHKFMWLKSRLQQSEKERQSLEEDNRLFKLEFGDRINSLQLEVDQLTKQRGQLELELKRERERRLRSYQGMPENRSLHVHNKGFQKTRSKIDAEDKCLEGDHQQHTSVNEANTHLSSKGTQNLQEEHEQPLGSEKLQLCQLCKEESTRNKSKNTCRNCGGIFCEECSANELPLPSSINPERVCNHCHKRLIEQYSASPS